MTTPPPARPPPTANVLAFVMGKASSILIVQAPTPPLSPLCVTCTFRLEAGQHSSQLAELLFTHAMCAQAIDHYHRRQLWRRERRPATRFRARANTTLLSGAGPLSSIQAARAGGRMRGTGGAWPRGQAQSLRRAAHLSGHVELAGSRGRWPPRGPRTHLTRSRSNM